MSSFLGVGLFLGIGLNRVYFGHTKDCTCLHLYTDHIHCLIDRASRINEGSFILSDLESDIDLLDNILLSSRREEYACSRLAALHVMLASLHQRWANRMAHESVCSQVATGISGASLDYNAAVGRPRISVNVEMIELLHSAGYKMKKIAHALMISRTTLWRRLAEENVDLDRYSNISDDELDVLVGEIQTNHPHSGRGQGQLESQGIRLQRYRLIDSIHRTNPIESSLRWQQVIQRRTYNVPGPNSLWHIDSHHSLIQWRFVIHGCIDGYSRLITHLKCCTDNKSATTLDLFMNSVHKFGLPSRVCSDKGMENIRVCEYMVSVRGTGRQPYCWCVYPQSAHREILEGCLSLCGSHISFTLLLLRSIP